jgi:hypothetical protein
MKFKFILLLLISSLLILSVKSVDLEIENTFVGTFPDSDMNSWTDVNLKVGKTSLCGTAKLAGGYNCAGHAAVIQK